MIYVNLLHNTAFPTCTESKNEIKKRRKEQKDKKYDLKRLLMTFCQYSASPIIKCQCPSKPSFQKSCLLCADCTVFGIGEDFWMAVRRGGDLTAVCGVMLSAKSVRLQSVQTQRTEAVLNWQSARAERGL